MFKNKNLLITGGTGSFGNKLVETVLKNYKPKKLIIFSRDEFKQHQMRQRFKQKMMVLMSDITLSFIKQLMRLSLH